MSVTPWRRTPSKRKKQSNLVQEREEEVRIAPLSVIDFRSVRPPPNQYNLGVVVVWIFFLNF